MREVCLGSLANIPGILRDKTMVDKFIYNPNYDKQNHLFCRSKILVTNSLEPTNQDLIKEPKIFKPTNKITLL